jgi:cyclopropane-fatty-acyl-phospholipid synthase
MTAAGSVHRTRQQDTGQQDTNLHYDQDPELFGLFLDPLRKYSSGLYESPDDTLAIAQERKLRFVARRLGIAGGDGEGVHGVPPDGGATLLDVGCGWGSLVLFMAAEYGCRATGISPAPRQHAYIAERAKALGVAGLVHTEAAVFEHASLPPRTFDAITMLGSIVHMPSLDGAFDKARHLLRRGGTLYVSESCFRSNAAREAHGTRAGTRFVRDGIFGWGDLRPLSALVQAAENAGFAIIAIDDLTAHYRRTIEDWLSNIRRNRPRIDDIAPGYAADLERYLEIANAGWGYTTKHYALTCRNSR